MGAKFLGEGAGGVLRQPTAIFMEFRVIMTILNLLKMETNDVLIELGFLWMTDCAIFDLRVPGQIICTKKLF